MTETKDELFKTDVHEEEEFYGKPISHIFPMPSWDDKIWKEFKDVWKTQLRKMGDIKDEETEKFFDKHLDEYHALVIANKRYDIRYRKYLEFTCVW